MTKKRIALEAIPQLPPMEKVKAIVALAFSALVGIAFLGSLFALLYFKIKDPKADIAMWLNVFLTCLGYVVGIIAGLFGIPTVPAPPKPSEIGR